MNDCHSPDSGRRNLPRWVARAAVVAIPVVALSALVVGPAAAHEKHDEGAGFSPTQPVDAFADHWEEYHKDKDITEEPNTIVSDPDNYIKIHQEMAEDMLGH